MQLFMGEGGSRRLYAQKQTMHELTDFLASQLRQDTGPNAPRVIVNDATGLPAKYDFTLTFSREGAADSELLPDIFRALRSQLGLKLEQRKLSVRMMVIDHMEKRRLGIKTEM